MVPLFGGVPGGPELLIILLILLLLFGGTAVLVLVLGLGGLRLSGGDGAGRADDERVAALERELAETRAELAELRDDRDPESEDRTVAENAVDADDGGDDYDEPRSA
ncbi:preprotein translocase subunit TatA [Halobaculum rubrum]|uniref:preprotein translocase subunit TatA n=1 Tax=Halobaculum rubrum TaxID=2872158 RepID=UPI001CA3B544|nr:preprotein translocase subunit TatA [Halobaculum rubrum]QZY00559.1 preprotein translocase subunit TatA [Halobaculum rubrum]